MNSNQIREVNYKEYKLVDKREYTYYGLRVGIIDGSSYSKQYAVAFQLPSEEAPYILDIEKYKKRGKELPAAYRLIERIKKKVGKKFVDIVIVDGL